MFLTAPGQSYIIEIHLDYTIKEIQSLEAHPQVISRCRFCDSCSPRIHLIVYVLNSARPTTPSGSLPHPLADVRCPTSSIAKEAAIVRILTIGRPKKSSVILPFLLIRLPFPRFLSSVGSQFSVSGTIARFQGAIASADG